MGQEDKTSGFLDDIDLNAELLYTEVSPQPVSAHSFSQLYTCRRNGKLYMLKGLKQEVKNQLLYQQLLRKEYEIGYNLDHPNICKIWGWKVMPEVGMCIVMEYIDGETLDCYMERRKLDLETMKHILTQICDALSYVNLKQVVHRDLKPENIMITYNGGNVKLIDFGFADSSEYEILKSPAGTLQYTAPEVQNRLPDIDGRADIYSFGVVLNEILSHCPNRNLQKVARRCAMNDRNKRFATFAEVRKAIIYAHPDHGWGWLIIALVMILMGIACWWFSKPVNEIPEGIPSDQVPSAIMPANELER